MPTRHCGDCQLCCRLLPTPEINKPHSIRCPHQKHGVGCAIYAQRPSSCELWSCAWLIEPSTADLPRPDRAHYVIDTMPDFITVLRDDDPDAEPQHVPVVQVWVDPAHPDAHRSPALRRWLVEKNMPAVIRYGSYDGFLLLPPSMTGQDDFVEHTTSMSESSHTLEQKAAALGGSVTYDRVPTDGETVTATLTIGNTVMHIAAKQ